MRLWVWDGRPQGDDFRGCPVLLDRKHELVKACGATVTPETAVLSPQGKLLYRGRIDDRFARWGQMRPTEKISKLPHDTSPLPRIARGTLALRARPSAQLRRPLICSSIVFARGTVSAKALRTCLVVICAFV